MFYAPVEPDEEIYAYSAWNLMDGGEVFKDNLGRSPVQLYTIVVFYHLFGLSLESARLVSVLFSSFTILIIYLIGKRLTSENGALLGSALYALSPFVLRYSYVALNEPFQWFFLSLSLLFFIEGYRKDSLKYFALSGFLIALATGIRRSSLAIAIGLFLYLVITEYSSGLKALFKKLTIFAAAVTLPIGVPLLILFKTADIEKVQLYMDVERFVITERSKDPWWVGIQITWYAPILLIGLSIIMCYFIYTLTHKDNRKHVIGISMIAFLFLVRTSTYWEWGPEIILILGVGVLFLLMRFEDKLSLWSTPFSISLAVSLSYVTYVGPFLKVITYLIIGLICFLSISSYIHPKYAGTLTAILISIIGYLYLIKPEPHLIELLLFSLPLFILSTALIIPIYKRESWPATALCLLITVLLTLAGAGLSRAIAPSLITASILLLLLPYLKKIEKYIIMVVITLHLLVIPILKISLTPILITLILTSVFICLKNIKNRHIHYSLLALPLGLVIFHPSLIALSSVVFLYLTIFFIHLLPTRIKSPAGTLATSVLSTFSFYLRYAFMTVYTFEFTPIASIFTGSLLSNVSHSKRMKRIGIFLILTSTILSSSIFANSPFFVENERDQHPYMSTVRMVATEIEKLTDEGEYILAWHTFAVEAKRKTIIWVSNAGNYPGEFVVNEMINKDVRVFVRDFYLDKILWKQDIFREYIEGNFTVVKNINGIEIYVKT